MASAQQCLANTPGTELNPLSKDFDPHLIITLRGGNWRAKEFCQLLKGPSGKKMGIWILKVHAQTYVSAHCL